MTFEELCEARKNGPSMNEETALALLDEAWRLRIVINVLECTLNLWMVMKGPQEPAGSVLLRQHAAAVEALDSIDR